LRLFSENVKACEAVWTGWIKKAKKTKKLLTGMTWLAIIRGKEKLAI